MKKDGWFFRSVSLILVFLMIMGSIKLELCDSFKVYAEDEISYYKTIEEDSFTFELYNYTENGQKGVFAVVIGYQKSDSGDFWLGALLGDPYTIKIPESTKSGYPVWVIRSLGTTASTLIAKHIILPENVKYLVVSGPF